ncbi:hypothetical protein HT136_23210 [Novosphingobium profundi]|uniref:hypothetical protein n=1 Tax=Novosphingobium profundi TaxID=1774954 RepID=UPI001BD99CDA|nr:hypothetical protein [Novosphingobium profundi]MBT0671284.1 hypothetical protein [Novosphingobium profundi]
MATLFEITDTQTLNMYAFAHQMDEFKGRVDVWLEEEAKKPRRVMLFNDPMFQFPEQVEISRTACHSQTSTRHWTEELDEVLHRLISTPHKLSLIFDEAADASDFQAHLTSTATKFTTFFDLPEWVTPDGDPQAVHDWIVANAKGRVMVWLTYGSYVSSSITFQHGEVEHFERWDQSEDTSLIGIYDRHDPNAYPSAPHCGVEMTFIQHQDPDMFVRIMFREPNDAMLFRLSAPTAEQAEQPEADPTL